MRVARVMSELSTCSRRRVGCVLVDKHSHIIGVGYNGVPAGRTHCTDVPCAGAIFTSGQGLDECEATHAEANALLQCKDVMAIETVYCTTSPCIQCVKFLMNTSAKKIVFSEAYPQDKPRIMWEGVGRIWSHVPDAEDGRWVDREQLDRFVEVSFRMEGLEK